MRDRYPAFLKCHSYGNCFGYTQNLSGTAVHNNVDGRHFQKSLYLGNYILRSCQNPRTTCVIQLYGEKQFSHVFVNSVFLEVQGFKEDDEVILEKLNHISTCTYIEVTPRTNADYNVIAQNQHCIEEEFLNQIQIVQNGMLIPFFVSNGIQIQLQIGRIEPPSELPVMLNQNTELHVKSDTVILPESEGQSSVLGKVVENMTTPNSSSYSIEFEKKNLIARILPKKIVEAQVRADSLSPEILYIPGKANSMSAEFGIIQLGEDCEESEERNSFLYVQRIPAKVAPSNVFQSSLARLFSYYESSECLHAVSTNSKIEEYTRIGFKTVSADRIVSLKSVDVIIDSPTYTWLKENNNLTKLLEATRTLGFVHPILLRESGRSIEIMLEERPVGIHLIPSNDSRPKYTSGREFCYLADSRCDIRVRVTEKSVREIMGEDETRKQSDKMENFGFSEDLDIVSIGSQSELIKNILTSLEVTKEGHLMLTGDTSSGKTVILTRLAKRLAKNKTIVFSQYLNCSQLKGKSVDHVERTLIDLLKALERRKPSLLFLDDLDTLLPMIDEDQRHLGIERIIHSMAKMLQTSSVRCIITATRIGSLSDEFVEITIRSKPIIDKRFEIGPLQETDREELITHLLQAHSTDVENFVTETEGYSFDEITKVCKLARVECFIRGSTEISQEDVANAMKQFKKMKIGKVEVNETMPSMGDVGGMFAQKEKLEQVIMWPKKYPQLYESIGIGVSKGILLHGPSGCGKTLLANALVSWSNLNVVAVKGPELLSKYIGSSEENVRAVFEKARASAPCILFFDELDSLAPKRGSDSTGVTDRVVNQLLTELDGAEGGMKGVIVVGCTSRKDLIDEALLRPGRFDQHLLCTYPSLEEREDILNVVLKKVEHSEIPIGDLAQRTEGWTGADIQMLFVNARFAASRRSKDSVEDPLVTAQDVEDVFEESQPKASKVEIDTSIGRKVTLA